MENLRCFSFYVLLLSLRASVIARMWHKSTLKGFRWKRCSVNMFLSFALKISESPKQWPNTLPEESLHTNHRHNMKHRKNEKSIKRYKKSLHTNHHQNQQNLKLNLGKPSKNIARGTSDPGYWVQNHTWYLSFFLHARILSHTNLTLGKCVNLRHNCFATKQCYMLRVKSNTKSKITHW